MKSWTDISSLDVSRNRSSHNQSMLTTLCGSLSQCYNLRILNLSFNVLDEVSAVVLGGALKHCTKILRLDVSSCSLESDALRGITEGLAKCVNLVQLNINLNKLLFSKIKGAQALTALEHCVALQELDVSSNDIDYDGFGDLANGITAWRNLHSLDVSNNRSRIKPLFKSLKQCDNLQVLILSSNVINGKSAVALGEALACSTKICKLDISSCSLQSDGVKAVSEGLKKTVLI